MNWNRATLGETVTIGGRGLHSGEPVTMRMHPGSDGIVFQTGEGRVPAVPRSVVDTQRCTRLRGVSTVEHLMSALAGLEITDVLIEVEGAEVPGLDGSAAPFVQALTAGGRTDLGPAEAPDLFRRLFRQEDSSKIAIAKGSGHWRYDYRTEARWPVEQTYESPDVIAGYVTDIAPARTFALLEEVPHLLERGLGLGLDDRSALILGPDGYKNEARFADEPARHKLLDAIGDLYLAGIPVRFLNVVAERSGHTSNVHAAQMLRQAIWGEE
jgi:UDP-3-O-acyl-N-acetylglucosamine deacetylase